MVIKRMIKNTLLTVSVALVLTACGFHLRGNIPLPDGIKNMFVAAPKGSFKDELEDVLIKAGGVMTNEGGADTVLIITSARSDRTVGTLDARGKADSYNLDFSVEYRLEDSEGNLLREAELSETRRYNFDPQAVLESESEEADLIEDMETDIALRIVRQLSTVTDLDYQDAPSG